MTDSPKTYYYLQLFYLLAFFANGALFPLLAVYLQEDKGLNHTQIGAIVSAIPLVTIFLQPVWGALSDYTRRPRRLLFIASVAGGFFGLLYPFLQSYTLLLLGMILVAVFQSGIVPLSDSLAINYVQSHNKDYGNIRLMGSVGFAVSVFILGRVTEIAGSMEWIFYAFSLGLFLSLLTLHSFPERGQGVGSSFRSGVSMLFRQKTFMLFLLSNLLIFGPVSANNYYFGTFILTVGGTLSGVGLAFLLAAGSEAPFMKMTQQFINKIGIVNVMVLSGVVSSARWLLYFFEPSTKVVYSTTIVQGISVGLYVPAALIFVRDIVSRNLQATAIGVYSAVGNGIGNAFFTFLGGIMIDVGTVYGMYGFFSLVTLVGIIVLYVVQRLLNKQAVTQSAGG